MLRLARALIFCCAALISVTLFGCGGGATSTALPPTQQTLVPSDVRVSAAGGTLGQETQPLAASAMMTERAVVADRFVDSIGVNTHFTYGPYASHFPQVKSALVALGVRHIRDGVTEYWPQWSFLNQLAAVGIHDTAVVGEDQSMNDVVRFPSHVPGAVEAFEGPNEVNNDVNWAPKLRAFQHLLYTTVKQNPATAHIPVIGPSLGLWRGAADYPTLGNISGDMDYGNVHDYFGGNFPDVGSIPWILARANLESGTKPIIATESGYCTNAAEQGVPLDVQGDYIPRMFFDQYMNGIPRTLDYSFIDDGTGSSNLWMNCGLLTSDLRPKPSYTALKNVISLLSDRGASFAPKTLSYSLSDTRHDVHHMLLQKRDGTFYLAIWLDTSQYNQTDHYEIGVPSRPITVRFGESVRSLQYNRIRSDGTMYTENVSISGGAATVLDADSVGLLHITL